MVTENNDWKGCKSLLGQIGKAFSGAGSIHIVMTQSFDNVKKGLPKQTTVVIA